MALKLLKTLGDIQNLHDIRTAGAVRRSGKPQLPTTAILELYMRRNERDRLVKETMRLKKRKHQVEARLKDIDKEIARQYERATKMAAELRGGSGSGGEARAPHAPARRRTVVRY